MSTPSGLTKAFSHTLAARSIRALAVACWIETCHAFGIAEPRIALIHCAETASEKFPHTMGYAEIADRAARGEWGRAIVSGPLDFRTSCDAAALATKGISSPIAGSADGLILPDIEAAPATTV